MKPPTGGCGSLFGNCAGTPTVSSCSERSPTTISGWYAGVQRQYALTPYLTFSDPDPFLIQNRYTADWRRRGVLHRQHAPVRTAPHAGHLLRGALRGQYPWYWDPMSGGALPDGTGPRRGIDLDLGPAESMLIVFDRNRKGPRWNPLPDTGGNTLVLKGWMSGCTMPARAGRGRWDGGAGGPARTGYVNFAGDVVYRTRFTVEELPARPVLNLGRVAGIAEGGAERPSLRCALVRTEALRPDGIAATPGRIPSK
ncbi:MAG: hypothetical protein ACLR8Y_09170 [Alistipes indistinctus]